VSLIDNALLWCIYLENVKVHTSATGGEASTQVEGCNDQTKSNSERVADCGATPCSDSSFLDGQLISEVPEKSIAIEGVPSGDGTFSNSGNSREVELSESDT